MRATAETGERRAMNVHCGDHLEIRALSGLPLIEPGDDLGAIVLAALARDGLSLVDGDVIVVASKLVSRAEGRFVDLRTVEVSPEAAALAEETEKDPRLVELVLRETKAISRKSKGALVVRHKLGFVSADAGIDRSNARPVGAPEGSGPWALLLPVAPDASARAIREALEKASGKTVGVLVSDSFGRPFRLGTVGAAIGVAGLPPVWDRRGELDLYGRPLEHTFTALADQVAAAADLVAGQAAERRGAILVRGLSFEAGEHSAEELYRPLPMDLYR
ncbi:MAG: coenzyme F420-0:L-glutamate ligase [Byssovorax sp.]